MADRIQVQDLYKDRSALPTVTPVARPVDTFSRDPGPVQDTRLNQLASALVDIQPGLSKHLYTEQAAINEEDIAAGHQAALKSKQAFKDAVDTGAIPAGASPWFRVGWERQRARVAGYEYDQALKTNYEQSPVKNSDNPQALSAWMADFTQQWASGHPESKDNPEWNSTFTAMAVRAQDNLANQHAAGRVQAIEQDVIQNTDTELANVLDTNVDILGGRHPDTGRFLADVVNAQVANGLNGQVANKLVATAVARKAVEQGDVTILDVLQETPSGSGTVGSIGYVRDLIEKTKDQIATDNAQKARVSLVQDKLAKEATINKLKDDAVQRFLKNPHANLDDLVSQLSPIDADEAQKIIAHQAGYLSALAQKDKITEDPIAQTSMTIQALNGNLTQDQVMGAVQDGVINADSARGLLTDIIPKGQEHKSMLSNPAVTRIEQGIVNTIRGNEFTAKDENLYRSEQARVQFLTAMIDYRDKNPKATDLDLLKHGQELSDTIIKVFRSPDSEPLPPVNLNKINPTKDALFSTPEEMKAAVDEFNKSNDTSSRISQLAALYQMDPESLIRSQSRLLPPVPKAAPKK